MYREVGGQLVRLVLSAAHPHYSLLIAGFLLAFLFSTSEAPIAILLVLSRFLIFLYDIFGLSTSYGLGHSIYQDIYFDICEMRALSKYTDVRLWLI